MLDHQPMLEFRPVPVVDIEAGHRDPEEDLVLVEVPAFDLELDAALQHDGPEIGHDTTGLLADLSARRLLDGLAVVESSTRREPPRTGVRPVRISTAKEQDASRFVDQDHAGRSSSHTH